MTSDARPSILASYVRGAPDPQHALDAFAGEWLCRLPPPFAELRAGSIEAFQDARISQWIAAIGGIAGRSVLELGPLEGGHSYMLEQAGAAQIVAVEANTRAFLKCLVVKEILQLRRVQFLCGDAVAYLQGDEPHFDIGVASGVLYHLQDPIELIARLANRVDHLFLWTHYYDADLLSTGQWSDRYAAPKAHITRGFRHFRYRYSYEAALDALHFAGGAELTSCWINRADLFAALAFFGFQAIRILGEHPNHPHGPAITVVADTHHRAGP
jgi:hypothetical protein